MKITKLGLTFMLLGGLTLGIAATIDEQIEDIQNESSEDRVTLVNEFKTTLSTMTNEDRATAIDQFKTTMQREGTMTQTQTSTQTRARLRVNQMSESNTQQMTQRMNQHQTGSQAVGQAIQRGTPIAQGSSKNPMNHMGR